MLQYAVLAILHSRCMALVVCCGIAGAATAQCQLLCNEDFEAPPMASGVFMFMHESLFECWRTTAPDGQIERWGTGFNGVEAFSGNAFVELNANTASGLFQDFTAPLGAEIIVTFAHRGRDGTDVMTVELGHDGVFTSLATEIADNNLAWGFHTLTHTLPTTGSTTFTLRFSAVSTAGNNLSVGNFLDAIGITVEGIRPELVLSSTGACVGSPVGTALAAVSGGSPPYSYAWTTGGNTESNATGLLPGMYGCTVTDSNGCTDTASVTVAGFPIPAVTLAGTPTTCWNIENGTASATVTGGTAPFGFAWSPVGGNGQHADGLPPGNYTCQVIDVHGCTGTGNMTIGAPPPIRVVANGNSVCAGHPTALQAEASGGEHPYTYLWSPAGPVTTPTSSGVYNVVATDANGCASLPSEAFVEILVDGCDIEIPNVITPNDDGVNDRFVISGIRINGNRVRVFNRWGKVVFEAADYHNHWSPKGLSPGTYYYEITAEGITVPFTGHLTILGTAP